jgi:hypothetical protein
LIILIYTLYYENILHTKSDSYVTSHFWCISNKLICMNLVYCSLYHCRYFTLDYFTDCHHHNGQYIYYLLIWKIWTNRDIMYSYCYIMVVALYIKPSIIYKRFICLIDAFCLTTYGREGCGDLEWDGENGRVNVITFVHKHSEWNKICNIFSIWSCLGKPLQLINTFLLHVFLAGLLEWLWFSNII